LGDVILCECFARDGLQHEPQFIATAQKVALIDRFASSGFARVEATSYANPRIVVQFADASAVLRALPRRPGVHYKATCANLRAVQRALADAESGFGVNEISVLLSASESHSMRNLKRTREEQWRNIEEMAKAALGHFRVVGTISVAFGCPFEGLTPPQLVVDDARRLSDLGVGLVTIGDTTGIATPRTVRALFARLADEVPDITSIAHFHDTRGTGIVNCLAAYEAGIRYFDCAFGGTGGHPASIQYGEGFTGNVATEDLVSLFEAEGISTGVDLGGLLEISRLCEETLGRTLHARVPRCGLHPGLRTPS